MKSPKEIRKSLIWGAPLIISLIISCVWCIKHTLYESIESLVELDSVVKIIPGAPVIVYAPIMFGIALTALFLGAIPCKKSTLKIAEHILNISVFVAIAIMIFCIFIITPIQYYAMPKLGYTRCNILEGHPTIYFTDWVKNPDWCVRGKSREWVREQARLASGQDS